MDKNKNITVGICLGASRVTAVKLSSPSESGNSLEVFSDYHGGSVKNTLRRIINENGLESFPTAVTGRKFRALVALPGISEPEAVELAYGFLKEKYPHAEAVVSAGGETFMVYRLDPAGRITAVYTGGKCASGTGEFFMQQVKRIGLDVEEVPDLDDVDDPYRLSGRCSVFCKSDCTHALNKGERKERVLAGLSKMMSDKIVELLGKAEASEILLIGGTARNRNMVRFLKERLRRVTVPEEADCFEALGAALWAAEKKVENGSGKKLFRSNDISFDTLPPLSDYMKNVTFHTSGEEEPSEGERCILGVDVGSTTTKAVLLRESDAAMVGQVYLRTDGDPVGAARKCYSSILGHLKGRKVDIVGHGVTGSGRQIVALHGMAGCVVNEIIAHAEAALYYDPEVDTIFEIGGQDAKYTYITDGVPSDYAMNEACSAGTGSFLEEAARESLNIKTGDIADNALKGTAPVNFNDQCAAFIGSDIKNAIQEGVSSEDISAGLVYSVCMNYSNRVKGSRPTGERIFMQGGVCYNRAVPAAMASLTGMNITVPPHPGLMGAFGVALIAGKRIREKRLEETQVDLEGLASRSMTYRDPFICRGDAQGCDRKCRISVIEIEEKKYPFGGICNRFDNLVKNTGFDLAELDLVSYRENLLYRGMQTRDKVKFRVGINRSLNNIALLPLFAAFFEELGAEVVLPEEISSEGTRRQNAPFCYPVEISHGYMHDLLGRDTDYIFLPHIKGLHVPGGLEKGVACVLSQGEPYYLKAAYPELEERKVLSPVLNFSSGLETARKEFIRVGKEMGFSRSESARAYKAAVERQESFRKELRKKGREVLGNLEKDPSSRAIVLFGRAYNAFASFANMGIPRKLATRGEQVLTIDMLPLETAETPSTMYWAAGQMNLQAAELVGNHPQLFGVYITNFSCGPDSFLTGFFRRKMKGKPSLILELDSHSADAGLDTRIDAFMDIINAYESAGEESVSEEGSSFLPAEVTGVNGKTLLKDSSGNETTLVDERVRVIVPSMGRLATKGFVSSLRHCGVDAVAAPEPSEKELRRAKTFSTCKECLPLQLTLGTLLNYLDNGRRSNELTVYFMPESDGPCRFGQYNVLMKNVIEDLKLKDVAILSPTSTNSYAGLDRKFARKAWQGFVISDSLDCIRNSLLALASDKDEALEIFRQEEERIFESLAGDSWSSLKETLSDSAERFSRIPLKGDYNSAPKVLLAGEIYVRNDSFSRKNLIEKLADRGIITRISPAYEWLYYTDYCMQNNLDFRRASSAEKFYNRLEGLYRKFIETSVKRILSGSGLCGSETVDVARFVDAARDLVSPHLTGEAVLTVGAACAEIIDDVAGVISVGPFGCMPGRLSESVISKKMSDRKEAEADPVARKILERFPTLPYLAIETDGNAFPQVTEARLEAFGLQVERLNRYLEACRK